MKNGFTEVIATKLEERDGALTGKFASRNCYGEEKVNRLKEFFTDRGQVFITAYGDSNGDKPMLNYANHGVLIK
jgi:phosphoserine phosphatase